jgi:hypothetical protein
VLLMCYRGTRPRCVANVLLMCCSCVANVLLMCCLCVTEGQDHATDVAHGLGFRV